MQQGVEQQASEHMQQHQMPQHLQQEPQVRDTSWQWVMNFLTWAVVRLPDGVCFLQEMGKFRRWSALEGRIAIDSLFSTKSLQSRMLRSICILSGIPCNVLGHCNCRSMVITISLNQACHQQRSCESG